MRSLERKSFALHDAGTGIAIAPQLPDQSESDRALIEAAVTRIMLGSDEIAIELTSDAAAAVGQPVLHLGWSAVSQYRHRVILPPLDRRPPITPMRVETYETLLDSLGRGHAWLDDLLTGAMPDIDAIAIRESRSKRTIHMMLSLAFVAPDIIEAAIAGKLPSGIAMRQLIDLPADWTRQRTMLGLA